MRNIRPVLVRFVVAAVVLVSGSVAGQESRWTQLLGFPRLGTYLYADFSQSTRDSVSGTITLWVKRQYGQSKVILDSDGRKYRFHTALERLKVDRAHHLTGGLGLILYDASGDVVSSVQVPDETPVALNNPPPDTDGDYEMRLICKHIADLPKESAPEPPH